MKRNKNKIEICNKPWTLQLLKKKDRYKNIDSNLIGFNLIADNNRKSLTKFMLSSKEESTEVTRIMGLLDIIKCVN